MIEYVFIPSNVFTMFLVSEKLIITSIALELCDVLYDVMS